VDGACIDAWAYGGFVTRINLNALNAYVSLGKGLPNLEYTIYETVSEARIGIGAVVGASYEPRTRDGLWRMFSGDAFSRPRWRTRHLPWLLLTD
jgi:hypothetical protein